MKNRAEITTGKLRLSEFPEKLWTHLTVDFITKLLVVAEKDVILVVCNRLFKRVEHHIRNLNETVNSISPTNEWLDRKNESGARTISEVLCRL